MKIGVYSGEAFPIYSVYEEWSGSNIEVDAETFLRWKKVFDDFAAVQEEICDQLRLNDKSEKIWAGGTWSGFDDFKIK
jgi:hypothetical protein